MTQKSNYTWSYMMPSLHQTKSKEREDFKEDVKEIEPVMPQKQLNREKRD